MRKPKKPTIITEAPYKGTINGKIYLIVPTNAGEFTVDDLHRTLDKIGVKMNRATLYDRVRNNWANPMNLTESALGNQGRRNRGKVTGREERSPYSVNLGSWERQQLKIWEKKRTAEARQ